MKLKSFIAILLMSTISVSQGSIEEIKAEDEPNLISPDSQVNYSRLKSYLTQQDWRKANDETRELLLEASGRGRIGWARTEDLEKLSCWDLKTVNQLWQEHSDNKFGFSSQLPIYLETGNRPGKLISDEAYNMFGDRLGWRKDNDWIIFIENLNYSLDAPIGHFPNPRPEYSITGGRLYYSTLASRMVDCGIPEVKAQKPLN